MNRSILRVIIGIVAGLIIGYFYNKFIGCRSGSCPLQSTPYYSMLMFSLIGGILLYKKDDSRKDNNSENN